MQIRIAAVFVALALTAFSAGFVSSAAYGDATPIPYPDIRDEQGLEVFYNYAVTPWLVIGADVQFIRPGLDHDTAIFTGLRTVSFENANHNLCAILTFKGIKT